MGVTGRGQLTKSITNRERGIAAADYNPIPRTKTSGRKKSCLLANLRGGEGGGRSLPAPFDSAHFTPKVVKSKKGKSKVISDNRSIF